MSIHNNPFFENLNQDSKSSILRFENFILTNKDGFFDLEQILDIIDYYIDIDNDEYFKLSTELALNLYPNDIDVNIRYSKLLSITKGAEQAIKNLIKISKLHPDNADLYYSIGMFYSELGNNKKAIFYLRKCVSIEEDAETCFALAQELAISKQFHESIIYSTKVLDIENNNELALRLFSYCTQFIEPNDSIKQFLHHLCSKNPYSFENWFCYGMVLSNFNLHFDAITAFDFCNAIEEDNIEALIFKAQSQLSLNNINESIKTLHEALEIDSKNPLVLFNLAQAYEKLNNWTTSAYYYRECTKYEPENSEAWMGVGYSYFELNDFNSAEPFILKALELDNDNIQHSLTFAEMLYKENRAIESEEIYAALYETGKELEIVTSSWAYMLEADKRPMDAIKLLEDTISNHPFKEPFLHLTLVEIGCKIPMLTKFINEALFDIFLQFDIDYKTIEKFAPSVLITPGFEEILNSYIDEDEDNEDEDEDEDGDGDKDDNN